MEPTTESDSTAADKVCEKLPIPKQQSVDTNGQKDHKILSNIAGNDATLLNTKTTKIDSIPNSSSESNNLTSNNKNNLNFDSTNLKCQMPAANDHLNLSGDDLVNGSNERLLTYKEYVNRMYDEDIENDSASLLDCDLEKQNSSQNQSSVMTDSSNSSSTSSNTNKIVSSEDCEPLLEAVDKSPTTATSFPNEVINRKQIAPPSNKRLSSKRLSWHENSNSIENCERPTNLHVQFESSNVNLNANSCNNVQSSSKKQGDSQNSTPSKSSVRLQEENLDMSGSGSSSSDEDDSEDK